MDLDFASLRLSCSSSYWIQDTMRMRYGGLQEMQRISLSRENTLCQGASLSGLGEGRRREEHQGHQTSKVYHNNQLTRRI